MVELDKGSLTKHIFNLSLPIIAGNLFINIISAFELYLIGTIGLESLAAVSIINTSIFAFYLSIHGGLINCAITLISRYTGRKDYERANKTLAQMLLFSVFIFGVYFLLIYFFKRDILVFFGAKGDVLRYASEYVDILCLSFASIAIYSLSLGILRGAGDSIIPLKIIVVCYTFIGILNVVFIKIFKLGLKGAALSNLISFSIAALIYILIFMKGIYFFKIKLKDFIPDFSIWKNFFKLTLKAISQGFISDIGAMAMLKMMAGMGNEFIAAYGIVMKLFYFVQMFGWPIGNSAGVMVGHNLGARNSQRARQAVVESMKIYFYITLAFTILFLVFTRQITGLFTTNDGVIYYADYFLRLLAFFLPVLCVGLIIQSGFNGAGAIGTSAIVIFVSYIIIRIPLAYAFMNLTPLKEFGIYWAIVISIAINSLLFWILFKGEKWLQKKI
ncbi:MAG: MATE family efflux transporter [Candidatus Goldbacteria bacterium]|nr:MATE family efflux transporter [Candidatus Goldiibacteriota bacterium]